MSMISEQIEFLRDEADYRCHVLEDKALADTLSQAADTIEMLSEKARGSKQEWIPCSERLPGLGISVIVSYKDEVWHDFLELVDGECIPFWYMSGESIGKTAWMPLPEPWKGADDD